MKRSLLSLAVIVSFFIAMGCTHALRITNEDEFFTPAMPPRPQPIKLGVTSPNDTHMQNSKYIRAIVVALQQSGNFEKIIYPYSQAMHQGQVDAVAAITITPRYSGRGSNFFVNFPGFLIWAPAIWGYGYIADIETAANVMRLSDGQSQMITVQTRYKFRQAEFDRTWTEISWLEVGAIALIGGIYFISYDTDVTDEFIAKASSNYGAHVASRIIGAIDITAAPKAAPPAAPSTAPPAASGTPETTP